MLLMMMMMTMIDVQGFEPAERENQAEGHVDGPREKKGSGAARRCDLFTLFDLYHEMPDENTNTDEKKYKEWHDKARRFLTQNNIIPAPRLHEENSKPEKEEEEEEEEEKEEEKEKKQ